MKKSTILLLDELTKITGHQTWRRIDYSCSGKWRGTTDHSILFDNKIKFFISNGMKNFERNLKEYIQNYKTFQTNKEKNIRIIQIQLNKDNKTAQSESLHTAELIDIGINTEDEQYFLWPYAVLKVNGKTLKFIETKLSFSMRTDDLREWYEDRKKYTIYTAGGIKQPDFIFGNVRFSSTEDLYQIP